MSVLPGDRSNAHHSGPVTSPGSIPSAARTDRLARAIVAGINGDASQLQNLFSHDVVGTGPVLAVTSRAELADALESHAGALLDVEIQLSPLDVAGNQAAVEWVASAVESSSVEVAGHHTGEVTPKAHRVRVRAVTVAEFDGDLITSFRSYWNDFPKVAGLREVDAR